MTVAVPREAMWPLIMGVRTSQLVYAAAKLGIADVLKSGPKTSVELARETDSNAGALRRMLRGLVTIDLLAELENGEFAITPLGEYLRRDVPGSMHGWAIISGELHHPSWGGVLHSVRTGRPALEDVVGMSVWQYVDENAELRDHLNRELARRTESIAAAVLDAYDFSPVRRVVDVGGGDGAMIAAVLSAVPHMTGILFDTPRGSNGARGLLERMGVRERCEIVHGDFFVCVPTGADAYILKDVIHDWDDDRAGAILARCRQAMSREARLLLVEMVMPERTEQAPIAVQLDLQMLVVTGGRERSQAEHRGLLGRAGFERVRVIPTASEASIVEAVPAGR